MRAARGPTVRKGRLSQFDFLSIPLGVGDGLTRSSSGFVVDRPWARARVEDVSLQSGWWWLEVISSAPQISPEVHLSCAEDPLVVIEGTAAPNKLIYLQAYRSVDLTLLLAAWPGEVPIARLHLRKLPTPLAMLKASGRALQLIAKPQFGNRLRRVVRRVAAGQPVGIGSASSISRGSPSKHEPIELGQMDVMMQRRIIGKSGISVLLLPEDKLHRNARSIVEQEFARDSNLEAVVCDVLTPEGIWHVPPPNRQLLRHYSYVGAPVFLLRSGLSSGYAVASLEADKIRHIALPLVERSSLPKRYPFHPAPTPVVHGEPTVSIIVPTARRTDLLRKSLKALATCTDYPAVQVIIVDNGADPIELDRAIQVEAPELDITVIRDHSEFNFSRLCNIGVKASSGQIVLLLNDDVEALRADWLKRMVSSVMEHGAGAVGARLLYPNHTLQHAGLMIGLGGIAGHFWKGLSESSAAFNPHIVYPGDRLAVTGACLAVKREAYDSIGGLDEIRFPIGFSDTDFCLRLLERGMRNIYRGDAVLIHHESQSRGMDEANLKKSRARIVENERFLERWKHMIGRDPVLTPGYDLRNEVATTHRAVGRSFQGALRSSDEYHAVDVE